jgi:predicted dehydrogenase
VTDERRVIRIALLGTGSIAQVVHLPILSSLPGVKLQALADVDRPRATAIAQRMGIPQVCRTDEEAFASPEIDAVVICTPSHLHEAQAIAALRAGKHVLVEKPLALDAAGAERVVKVAKEEGRCLMVAMNNRYRPDVLALKPFARGGELGDLFSMRAAWLNRKIRLPRPTWRHRKATAGGGALIDLGTQLLDLALWTLDYPKVERLVAHVHPGEGMEVEDAASMMVWIKGGPLISLEVTWSLLAERDRHSLQVLGTRGAASMSPLSVYKEVEHGLLDVTPPLQPGRENLYTASYRRVLTDFVDRVRRGETAQLPWEQVELMRLIALAYRSAELKAEIEA